jgi:hypothetical protein
MPDPAPFPAASARQTKTLAPGRLIAQARQIERLWLGNGKLTRGSAVRTGIDYVPRRAAELVVEALAGARCHTDFPLVVVKTPGLTTTRRKSAQPGVIKSS